MNVKYLRRTKTLWNKNIWPKISLLECYYYFWELEILKLFIGQEAAKSKLVENEEFISRTSMLHF